jgi:hypothetical protein
MLRDDASSFLPSWLVLHLMATAAYGRRRRQQLLESLQVFTSHAADAGIDFLLLKGMQFSERFYASNDDRWSRDLDVLIHAADQARAARLLAALGYRAEKQAWLPQGWRNRLAHARNWQKGDISIDLHHDFRVGPAYQLDVNRIFAASQSQVITGIELSVPCDEDCLLLLFVSFLSDIEQGRVRAKNLVDFYMLFSNSNGKLEWREFLQTHVDQGLRLLVDQVVMLLQVSLPRSCPFPGMVASMEQQDAARSLPGAREVSALLSAPRYSLANRRWFLRHHQGSTMGYLAWWLIGGVFRSGSVLALVRALMRGKSTP